MTDSVVTLHQKMCLSKSVGHVFGWYDNFYLTVSTPNERRETHAMATEFQVHPAGIIEPALVQLPGISTLVIPRLTTKQCKSNDDTRSVPLITALHWTKKGVPTCSENSITYAKVCAQHSIVVSAQEKDTK